MHDAITLRIYAPPQAHFDRTWRLADIEKVKS